MKNGNIGDFGLPTESELAEINKFTRRTFKADELYAFSVVLCDNDIDRDNERFADDALLKMAELFIGKTGIFDHSHKAENQCARVFTAEVITVDGKLNAFGQPYKQLKARAYMPKSSFSEELILDIEAGIKKEVSVGCSMAKAVCSVCGEPAGVCQHKKGKTYCQNGKKVKCCYELQDPIDAYEWSFVAVPAQPKAGVVKSFRGDRINVFGLEKCVTDGEVILTKEEAVDLELKYNELLKTASLAGDFIKMRKMGIVKHFLPSATENVTDIFLKALDGLEPEELFKLYSESEASETVELQLKTVKSNVNHEKSNRHFVI